MTLSLSVLILPLSWLCIVGDGWVEWEIDLPKLTTLVTVNNSKSLIRPNHIILEGDSRWFELTDRHATSRECDSSICILLLRWSEYKQWECVSGVIDRYWCLGESPESHPEAVHCGHCINYSSMECSWFCCNRDYCSKRLSERHFSHCARFDSIQETAEDCDWRWVFHGREGSEDDWIEWVGECGD